MHLHRHTKTRSINILSEEDPSEIETKEHLDAAQKRKIKNLCEEIFFGASHSIFRDPHREREELQNAIEKDGKKA